MRADPSACWGHWGSAGSGGGDWVATMPLLYFQVGHGAFWCRKGLFLPCLFLSVHSSYHSICYETLRIRSVSCGKTTLTISGYCRFSWHLSLWLQSWICNRNYIFPLLFSYCSFLGECSQPLKLPSPSLPKLFRSAADWSVLHLLCPSLLQAHSSWLYQETAYRCYIGQTFWFPWFSTGQSGETSLVVASVGDKTPFLTVILFVWITSIYFLSEASHKKLIPLSVFHLHWNWEYWVFVRNHKCFETCLIEKPCLPFCRDFSNRNQQR